MPTVHGSMCGFVNIDVDALMVDHFAGRMPECLKKLVVTDGGMLFHP